MVVTFFLNVGMCVCVQLSMCVGLCVCVCGYCFTAYYIAEVHKQLEECKPDLHAF